MDKKLAFVLSGGGARGALQVGAMYALLECGLQPDLFIGASIGAANATFLALNGFSKESLDKLAICSGSSAICADLLPGELYLADRARHVWAIFQRSIHVT